MLSAEMILILEKQRMGFTASVSADGLPNLSPKGTFVVLDNKTIAFGEIRSPQTLRNLRTNPHIAVNFVDPLSRKGFRVEGHATIAAAGSDLYEKHRNQFQRWGELAERIRNIVVIAVEHATLLTSPAYDLGAQEADLRSQWTQILLAAD